MTKIPDDIMETAHTVFLHPTTGPVTAIAKAILAERRRCALIARQWETSSFQDEYYAANSIADRIMAGEA